MNKRLDRNISSLFNYSFFVLLAIIMLYPLWYVIMYSFSDPNAPSLNGLYLWPVKFSLVTYKYVLGQSNIITGTMVSVFITVFGTVIGLLATALAAYPLSKEKMIGKKAIFGYFLFTMLFHGGMVPTYIVVRQLGMIDSLWALILPGCVSTYYMLILIKFYQGIPSSLFESARIDGANELYVFFKIVFPLSTAAFAAIGLFFAVGYWNDYLSAAIYINSSEKYPLQMVIYGMLTTNINAAQMGAKKTSVTPMALKMSAVVISLLPILIVYPFVQKYFMTGVMLGSVKG